MARSLGIRLGQRSFEIVVLDGGPKRAKLIRHLQGQFSPESDDFAGDIASALREAVEGENLPTESIGLVVETGLAAFRSVRLPFSDRAKIEEVIKYEVENQLPQWDIDDVIIDFLVLSSSAVESNLIVTAVPKAELAMRLAACEGAGLEPLEAELECSAVLTTAQHAGLLDPESACVLLHFGDVSTSVVLVDGGEVKSMRVIHSGAFAPDSSASEGSAAHEAHLEEVSLRIRRELLRTISASQTTVPIEAIYVSGYVADGLIGESVEGVPIEAIQVLPETEEGELENAGRFYAAWGAAMRQLGGGMLLPSLRREELRFLGKFERLELPLAVLGLLLVTLFSVRVIVTKKDIDQRQRNLSTWLEASNNYMLGNLKAGRGGNLGDPPERIADYAQAALDGEVAQTERYEQLKQIDSMIQQDILALQRQLGQDVEIAQPMSALEGMTLVLGVLSELKGSIGRFTIRRIESSYYAGKGTKPDRVAVKLDLTFRGAGTIEATSNYYSFINTVREKPWYVEDKPVKESVLETGDGIYVDGLTITVDTNLAENTSI